eukprot:COSAG02_NODE_1181_length_14030_cov_6.652143_10_plen_85_part_00
MHPGLFVGNDHAGFHISVEHFGYTRNGVLAVSLSTKVEKCFCTGPQRLVPPPSRRIDITLTVQNRAVGTVHRKDARMRTFLSLS